MDRGDEDLSTSFSSTESSSPPSQTHGVFEEMRMMMDEEELSGGDREVMAEMYQMVITGNEGWMEFLEQHDSLLDVDITIDHTLSCSCGRFFEQHPTSMEGAETEELENVLQQIRTGQCKHILEASPLDPNPPALSPQRASKRLLHASCASGYQTTKIAKYLLDKGVSINTSTNIFKYTALFRAVASRNREIVELLLDDPKIDVNICSRKEQYTPLMEAIFNRLSDIVILFLKYSKTNLNAQNSRGETPIIAASRMGETALLEKLLEAGADVNLRDNRYQTALTYSVMYDMKEVTKLLLKYGGDVRLCNDHGETPLLIAVNADNYELTQILLEAGADPNTPPLDDYTPLLIATYSNFPNIVQLLVDYDVNIHHGNRLGYQAIHIAAWSGFMAILTKLLSAGAEADVQTGDKNTPLSLAAHGNHTTVVELLLARGCNVNNADKDLDTPLLYSTYNSNLACTESLLAHGADPGCINRLGCTPLWNAVYQGDAGIVKLLLKLNIDLDVPSQGINQHAQSDVVMTVFSTPCTPLWVAAHGGHSEVAFLLIIAGCRIAAESWIGLGQFPGKSNDDEELKEMLTFYHSNPLPLTFLCRNFLRRLAGREVRRFTLLLRIPEKYRNFIRINDFLD